MPIKLKANNGNIELKAPIKQGGKVDSVNGMTGDVVLEIPSKTSQLINDSGFLTEHQDISGLATKGDIKTVESKINTLNDKVEAIPSLDGYATEQWVEDKGYLTEHQSLADYAKKSEIPTKTSELTNDSGYLTEHQSLADYATKAELEEKQDKLTAGDNITIANGIISASGGGNISGYCFYSNSTFTNEDKKQLSYIQRNMTKMTIPVYIDDNLAICIHGTSSNILFYTINGGNLYNNQVVVYNVLFSGTTLISTKLNKLQTFYLACNNSSVSGEILTNQNWSSYIPFSENNWVKTDSLSDGNLYNAKELILFGTTIQGYRIVQYYNFQGEEGNTLGLNANTYYVLNWDDVDNNKIIWAYDGNEIVLNSSFTSGGVLDYALYKI